MQDPIKTLEQQMVNVKSDISAVQDVAKFQMTGKGYRGAIENLVGDVSDVGEFNDLTAKYFYLYLVQNIVRKHNTVTNDDASTLVARSFQSAKTMTDRVCGGDLAYIALHEENAVLLGGTVEMKESGEVVITQVRSGRKGDKKERACQLYRDNVIKLDRTALIELFMTELEMSKAGATTYVYNCKKDCA